MAPPKPPVMFATSFNEAFILKSPLSPLALATQQMCPTRLLFDGPMGDSCVSLEFGSEDSISSGTRSPVWSPFGLCVAFHETSQSLALFMKYLQSHLPHHFFNGLFLHCTSLLFSVLTVVCLSSDKLLASPPSPQSLTAVFYPGANDCAACSEETIFRIPYLRLS
ncbi:hypothetical protein BDR26DRAFT_901246 [Obelidium mucronatum]|nr:hypothetical protein BDR26DRAFT_901246 [Obelidium mucronatum]